jgi:hypothetical protein
VRFCGEAGVMTQLNLSATRERRRMMHEDENGDRFISLKWFSGIMITILLSVMGAWAAQRHSFESGLTDRVAVIEFRQAGVLAEIKNNRDLLEKIYLELREHRNTGK